FQHDIFHGMTWNPGNRSRKWIMKEGKCRSTNFVCIIRSFKRDLNGNILQRHIPETTDGTIRVPLTQSDEQGIPRIDGMDIVYKDILQNSAIDTFNGDRRSECIIHPDMLNRHISETSVRSGPEFHRTGTRTD